MGLCQAYLYGLMYIVLTTFPTGWRERYHQSVSVAGLNYISLGLGYSLGILVRCHPHSLSATIASRPLTNPDTPLLASGRAQDLIYLALKRRNNNVGLPEYRIPLLFPVSALILPLGFLLYGRSAQHTLHWLLPNVRAFIFAAGIMMGFNGLMTYVLDSYTTYAACVAPATIVLRSVVAFCVAIAGGGAV